MLINNALKYIRPALIFCLFVIGFNSYAAKWALVVSDQAIIYSDIEMTSKIGYIKKGKKVRVGEVARNNGQLLPIIVSGRIAYVEVKDLQSSSKLESLQSATQRIQANKLENENRPQRLAAHLGSFLASGEVSLSRNNSSAVSVNGSEGSLQFLSIGVKDYRYSDNSSSRGFKSGLEYNSVSKNDFQLNYISFSADYFQHFHNYEEIDFLWYAGLTITPFSELKQGSLYTLNGYGVGAQGGVEGIYKLESNLYAHADLGYHYLKLMGFDFSKISSNTDFEVDYTLTGFKILAALSFFY